MLGRSQSSGHGLVPTLFFALAALTKSVDAHADEIIIRPGFGDAQPGTSTSEISAGVDAARDQWLVYSSLTAAPWSTSIYSDGWRLRLGGGYGQFSYDASHPSAFPCGRPPYPACSYQAYRYTVDHAYAEALLGYYIQLGRLTAKAFAGASMSSQHHREADAGNTQDGTRYGGKVALELWYDISQQSWTSVDASYATARDETSARWRTGWRLQPNLSFGPELRYDKNVETGDGYWNGRAGLFARYEWTGGEVSLAAGLAGRALGCAWIGDTSPYGTFNVLFQY